MKKPVSGSWVFSLLLSLASVTACGPAGAQQSRQDVGRRELDTDVHLRGLGARVVQSISGVELDADTLAWLGVGDPALPFQDPQPTAIDAYGPPLCLVALGDSRNDAIHLYSVDGTPKRSVTGGPSAVSFTVDPASVALHPAGAYAVMSRHKQWITAMSLEGDSIGRWQATPPGVDQLVGAESDITLLDPSRPVDHWFSGWRAAQQSIDWSHQATMRVWSGERVQTFGPLMDLPELFGPSLSRGKLDSRGDTLWFGRLADAVIHRYEAGPGGLELVDSLALPLAFQTRPPAQGLRDGVPTAARAENHLLDFAVDASGFIVLQALAYPDPDSIQTVQRWRTTRAALVRYDFTGDVTGAITLPGDFRRLAASGRYAYVLGRTADSGPFKAFVVPLGELSEVSATACDSP